MMLNLSSLLEGDGHQIPISLDEIFNWSLPVKYYLFGAPK